MKKIICLMLPIFLIFNLVGCSKYNTPTASNEEILNSSYEELLESAKGTTVNFYGYGGDEVMNKWFDNYVVAQMKNYDITVKKIGMNIDEIINKLLSEKQVQNSKGTIDVVWLNGENFKVAKDNKLLFGPFTNNLPNYGKYVNQSLPDITNDFGTPVDNMEAPWGRAQFAVAYDSDEISNELDNSQKIMEYVKNNPGKFTYPAPPDFTGSAFVRNIIYDVVGYENICDIEIDKEKIKEVIKPAMNYLNELKPYLWQEGKSYPSTSSQLENMYSDKEVYAMMTYAPNTLKNKIENNIIPKNTKIVQFDKGNISNTHFLAIPDNATNKEGAMVLIDFLMSIDAQSSKTDSKNWGDSTVLDMKKVPQEEKSKFKKNLDLEKTLPELPAIMIPIIEEIWKEEVLEGK
ncbi:MAG: ABC transporter substrate-binding protein [Romboutsia sp.]|uniref:ABC transporter substrate-binding protein n=1 Tax=Romboutsia sp. TaxID=1965302 RepID=UPI003F3DC7F3